jgi:hypothetical protein
MGHQFAREHLEGSGFALRFSDAKISITSAGLVPQLLGAARQKAGCGDKGAGSVLHV